VCLCRMCACVCVCVYTHTWAIMPSWQQASRCCIKLTACPCPLAPSPAQSAPVRIRLWLRADGAPSARSHSAHPVQAAVAAAMTIPHRLPETRESCRRCAGPASSSCPQCIAVVEENIALGADIAKIRTLFFFGAKRCPSTTTW
jgi:hypothetical protein